jgi:hypothetical protein
VQDARWFIEKEKAAAHDHLSNPTTDDRIRVGQDTGLKKLIQKH